MAQKVKIEVEVGKTYGGAGAQKRTVEDVSKLGGDGPMTVWFRAGPKPPGRGKFYKEGAVGQCSLEGFRDWVRVHG